MAQSYRDFIMKDYDLAEVILAGGGVHNLSLLNYLRELLPQLRISTQEDKGYSSDSKEAVAFVILGNETLHRRPSNVPKATGASQGVILGQITYPT